MPARHMEAQSHHGPWSVASADSLPFRRWSARQPWESDGARGPQSPHVNPVMPPPGARPLPDLTDTLLLPVRRRAQHSQQDHPDPWIQPGISLQGTVSAGRWPPAVSKAAETTNVRASCALFNPPATLLSSMRNRQPIPHGGGTLVLTPYY